MKKAIVHSSILNRDFQFERVPEPVMVLFRDSNAAPKNLKFIFFMFVRLRAIFLSTRDFPFDLLFMA
jgi:hypothetical protein